MDNLYWLGILDEQGELTSLGRLSANFPLSPEHAVCLIESSKNGCLKEILVILSLMAVG